jgi:hypothetical protein
MLSRNRLWCHGGRGARRKNRRGARPVHTQLGISNRRCDVLDVRRWVNGGRDAHLTTGSPKLIRHEHEERHGVAEAQWCAGAAAGG